MVEGNTKGATQPPAKRVKNCPKVMVGGSVGGRGRKGKKKFVTSQIV